MTMMPNSWIAGYLAQSRPYTFLNAFKNAINILFCGCLF